MDHLSLSVHPKDATKKILKTLANRRAEEIVARRFGLKDGRRHTLESIGKTYGITRERVRQLEEATLANLAKNEEVKKEVFPLWQSLSAHLAAHGGVSEEKRFFGSVADSKFHNHVNFILFLGAPVKKKEEDENHFDRWFVDDDTLGKAENVVRNVVGDLSSQKRLVSEDELHNLFKNHSGDVFGGEKDQRSIRSYVGIAKQIGRNPYNEYGLVTWPEIEPRGVRDKAYAVLAKAGKPLHFTDVASHINKVGWSKRSAHPQTVHNELIKDKRFVLVGRGLYALTDWGYEPGTVKDVLVSVLKKSGKSMSAEEITKKVLEKRLVKENTIFLNLQDKKTFKKADGGYTLV